MGEQIRFDDGAAYERYMGQWSQLVGEGFLQWLNPQSHWRWLDIGCGNGAFTELIAKGCTPSSIQGIDPSLEQLAFARGRHWSGEVLFRQADAMALPFQDNSFDVAVMPLVIFFVPEPAKGVSEMVRVVRPGGTVSAYAWDMDGGGFPYQLLRDEMENFGMVVPTPPSPESSSVHALQSLWAQEGLETVQTRTFSVQRIFSDIDDYWTTVQGGPSVRKRLAAMSPNDHGLLKERMRERLSAESSGRIICKAQANAVTGLVPET